MAQGRVCVFLWKLKGICEEDAFLGGFVVVKRTRVPGSILCHFFSRMLIMIG